MPPEPSRSPSSGAEWRWIAAIFLLASAVRATFTLAYPTIHGGDAAARLAHADSLVLGYQLPLAQLFVVLGKAVADDPVFVRLLFCAWGGVLAAGVTALLSLRHPEAARFAGLLLAFDPLLIHYSIVPYQEPVAYGLLAWAFYFGLGERKVAAGLLLGAACLTRFECWLFVPIFLFVTRSRAGALIGALPIVAWVAWWQGLAPAGLYVLDLDPGAGRLSRIAFLGRKFLEYETPAMGAAAVIAMLLALRRRDDALLKGVVALALVIVIVTAVGHEYPPGSGLMSERLIHLPVLLAIGLVATALGRFSVLSRNAFLICFIGVLSFAGRNVLFEVRLLRAAANEPDLALARDIARAIEAVGGSRECVSVTAPSVDPSLLDDYVGKVEASFGDVGRARERAQTLAVSAPDLDRIAAHLRAPVGTARRQAGCPLIVFVDESEPEGAPLSFVAEIRAGPRRARLLRIPR
jgi:hypothetical protein